MNEVDALGKEIQDVKIVMESDYGEYWIKYLRILEDEMVELVLLGKPMLTRAEAYRVFKDES